MVKVRVRDMSRVGVVELRKGEDRLLAGCSGRRWGRWLTNPPTATSVNEDDSAGNGDHDPAAYLFVAGFFLGALCGSFADLLAWIRRRIRQAFVDPLPPPHRGRTPPLPLAYR